MKFEIEIEGKELAQCLARLQSLSGGQIGAIYIKASKKQYVECQVELNNRRILIRQKCVVDHSGSILIDKLLLEGVCKGRATMRFLLKENSLNFMGGSYKGQLPIITMPDKINLLEFTEADKPIPKKFQMELQTYIKKCQIQSTYNTDKLSLFMHLRKNIFYVGVADQFHAALGMIDATDYVKDLNDFETPYMIPLEYANMLSSFSNKMQIFNKSSHVILLDEDTMLELPALQTQDFMLDALLNIKVGESIKIDVNQFKSLIESCNIANADLCIDLKKGEKEIKVVFKSDHGKISDSIKCKPALYETITLKIDVKNIKDVVKRLSGGEASLAYNRFMIQLVKDNVIYSSQLLQQD